MTLQNTRKALKSLVRKYEKQASSLAYSLLPGATEDAGYDGWSLEEATEIHDVLWELSKAFEDVKSPLHFDVGNFYISEKAALIYLMELYERLEQQINNIEILGVINQDKKLDLEPLNRIVEFQKSVHKYLTVIINSDEVKKFLDKEAKIAGGSDYAKSRKISANIVAGESRLKYGNKYGRPDSFKLAFNTQKQLREVYNALEGRGKLSKIYTPYLEFKAAFTGGKVVNKIRWMGNIRELKCFIDLLHTKEKIKDEEKYIYLEEGHSYDKWSTVMKCFLNQNGKEFIDRDQFRNSKPFPEGSSELKDMRLILGHFKG